jgi:CubicO group peptidase (beta-lactamase class C family)
MRLDHRSPQRRAACLALVTLLLAPAAIAGARTTQTTAERLDEYLTARTEMGGFSGAVLVAKGDKVLFRKGYGYADVDRRLPYTPETQHQIASISKMFVAMAALELRDRGKLRLEDSVCKYVENCPPAWEPVTITHLIHHTSGIPDYEEKLGLGTDKYMQVMTHVDATAKTVENAKALPLDFKPGEKFHYSNTAYNLLGYVVERAAGRPFEEFAAETIFRPAGMKSTGMFGRRGPQRLAYGYTYGDLGWEKTLAGVSLVDGHMRRVARLPLTPPTGDAGIYTTVDDLLRWSLVMDGSRLVPAARAAEVFTPGLEGYGFGWFVDEAFGRKRLQHTGGLPGYTSVLIKFPADRVTIVIFANSDRFRFGRIMRDVSAIALGQPYDLPVRGSVVKLAAEQVAPLEGDYRMADGKLLTVRNEPDYLTAKLEDRFTAGLIPLSATEFYFPLGDGKATFTPGADGRAVRVNLRFNGEDHVAERIAR